jgi:hypothetical protein
VPRELPETAYWRGGSCGPTGYSGAKLRFALERKIERISISEVDRQRLERLVRDRNTPQKVVWRARIVLLASEGRTAEGIAATVGKSLLTVRRYLSRRG